MATALNYHTLNPSTQNLSTHDQQYPANNAFDMDDESTEHTN